MIYLTRGCQNLLLSMFEIEQSLSVWDVLRLLLWVLKMTTCTVQGSPLKLATCLCSYWREMFTSKLFVGQTNIYLINDHSSLHVLNILQKFVKISIPVSLAEQFTVERPCKVIQSIFLLLNKDKFIRNSHRYYFQMPYICVLVTGLTSCDFPPFQTCRFRHVVQSLNIFI